MDLYCLSTIFCLLCHVLPFRDSMAYFDNNYDEAVVEMESKESILIKQQV